MNRFRAEIGEQPDQLERLLNQGTPAASAIANRIREVDPQGFVIAARGSSDNAALYAKYLFGVRNRVVVALAAPSLFTSYSSPPRLAGQCVIAISQSGVSPDVVAVVEEGRRQGCLTVSITNDADSPLAGAAELVLPMGAGREESVPASKTYTASLLALDLLSQALDPDADFASALGDVPAQVAAMIGRESEVQELAAGLNGPRAVVLGRGFNFSTAEEIALKLAETSYILARAWSIADFVHGPAAVIEPGLPVVLVDGGGAVTESVESAAERVAAQGGTSIVLAEQSGLPEALSVFPLVVTGQLLAYHAALARGIDPDQPRALQKVTRTW